LLNDVTELFMVSVDSNKFSLLIYLLKTHA
jgi:hypothetical protein